MATMDGIPKHPAFKQEKNERALVVYGLCLLLFVFVVIAARRVHDHCGKSRLTEKNQLRRSVREGYLDLYRWLDQRTNWRWYGRPTLALVTMVIVFIIGNCVLGSTIFALYRMNHWASRFGWLCVANMALCTFLGLKNTPLVSLASISPALLNTLHRIVGYTAVLFVCLHAMLYTVHNYREDRLWRLTKTENLEGIGAGLAMIVLLLAIYRHRCYEVFLASHIIAFVAVIVLAALHRPNWAKKMPQAMMLIGGLWLSDRALRGARLISNLFNNSVILTALPEGGTRMTLKKPHSKSERTNTAGLYYYVWIPAISFLQTHPFTAVAHGHDGLELVTKAQGGFTSVLYNIALKTPGVSFQASVDGPYGHLPDVNLYDKLVLVAGGSGAAFTFGLMNHIIDGGGDSPVPIEFIWAVRTIEQVHWYLEHLQAIMRSGLNINITVFVTRKHRLVGESLCRNPEMVQRDINEITPILTKGSSHTYESIQRVEGLQETLAGVNFKFERMEAGPTVEEAIGEVADAERVLVAACGPSSLTDEIKDTTEGIGTFANYMIDTHCEDFDG